MMFMLHLVKACAEGGVPVFEEPGEKLLSSVDTPGQSPVHLDCFPLTYVFLFPSLLWLLGSSELNMFQVAGL